MTMRDNIYFFKQNTMDLFLAELAKGQDNIPTFDHLLGAMNMRIRTEQAPPTEFPAHELCGLSLQRFKATGEEMAYRFDRKLMQSVRKADWPREGTLKQLDNTSYIMQKFSLHCAEHQFSIFRLAVCEKDKNKILPLDTFAVKTIEIKGANAGKLQQFLNARSPAPDQPPYTSSAKGEILKPLLQFHILKLKADIKPHKKPLPGI